MTEITNDETLGLQQDLERQIIAFSLINRGFFLNIHGFVKPTHFANKTYGEVWKFVQAYFNKHANLPSVNVVAHAFARHDNIDAETFTTELTKTDSGIEKWLEEEVVKIVRQLEFKKFLYRSIDEAEKKNPDYDKLETELKKILNIQTDINFGLDYFNASERYARILANVGEKIPMGIPSVDNVLGGGMSPKELYCFLAPPGVGKSLFLVWIGTNLLKQRKNVVHYTLEMSEERVSMRYDAALLKYSSSELIPNHEDVIKRIEMVKTTFNYDNHFILKEFPPDFATVNHFRSHLHKLREYKNFKPDVIIVDYGDIMQSTAKHAERYDKQGAAFTELRGLAVELGIPVITATQTNREALAADLITAKNVADSFDKVRIVDFMCAIMQKPEDRNEDPALAKLYILKNRNGAANHIFGVEIDYARNQIVDKGDITDE